MNPNVPPPNGGPPMYVPPTPQATGPQGDWPPPEGGRHSALAIGGFIVALCGVFVAWIPIVGLIGAVGGVLGVVAMFRSTQAGGPKRLGLAIAAIVLGSFDLIAAVFWLIVFESLRSMSCPHVYAFDGHDYQLDADPLSGSLFAAAESDDTDRLEHLAIVEGQYRIRVANDLQETDHLDRVALLVVDHRAAEEILPTQTGELLRLAASAAPASASDAQGRDLASLLALDDDKVFASNPMAFDASGANDPHEAVTMEFPRPAGDRAVLALRLHNTPFAVDAFTRYLATMGPGLDSLLRSAQDSDSYPYRQRIADEMRRLGLLLDVEVWTGATWERAGTLRPIGPAVMREQALALSLPTGTGPSVRIRLGMTPLFWEIDRARVAATGTPVHPLELQPSVCEGANADCHVWLTADQQRQVLRSGEAVDLAFDAPPTPAEGQARTVFVSIRGYYEVDIGGHGWMDPLAILAHRRGATSLPRFAVKLAQDRAAGETR